MKDYLIHPIIGQSLKGRVTPPHLTMRGHIIKERGTSADKLNKCGYFKFTNAVIEPHLINTHL